jgi:hypothetical protein
VVTERIGIIAWQRNSISLLPFSEFLFYLLLPIIALRGTAWPYTFQWRFGRLSSPRSNGLEKSTFVFDNLARRWDDTMDLSFFSPHLHGMRCKPVHDGAMIGDELSSVRTARLAGLDEKKLAIAAIAIAATNKNVHVSCGCAK